MGRARGEIVEDGRVLVIARIIVTYEGLTVPDEHRETVDKVLRMHAKGCPVARSLQGAIEIETRLAP